MLSKDGWTSSNPLRTIYSRACCSSQFWSGFSLSPRLLALATGHKGNHEKDPIQGLLSTGGGWCWRINIPAFIQGTILRLVVWLLGALHGATAPTTVGSPILSRASLLFAFIFSTSTLFPRIIAQVSYLNPNPISENCFGSTQTNTGRSLFLTLPHLGSYNTAFPCGWLK